MNGRWKQLADQCFDQRLDGPRFDKEQFAESIVRECMEVCEAQEYNYWHSSVDQDFTPIDCANAIKEHFGVEE
jgi:hypothetical protein